MRDIEYLNSLSPTKLKKKQNSAIVMKLVSHSHQMIRVLALDLLGKLKSY